MNEERYILEGWVLYAAIGLPFVAGITLCALRGVLPGLLLLAFAAISLAVGLGSVDAALIGTIFGTIWVLPSKKGR
jgi:hypothetical protein